MQKNNRQVEEKVLRNAHQQVGAGNCLKIRGAEFALKHPGKAKRAPEPILFARTETTSIKTLAEKKIRSPGDVPA
jgi:hypothetical protein